MLCVYFEHQTVCAHIVRIEPALYNECIIHNNNKKFTLILTPPVKILDWSPSHRHRSFYQTLPLSLFLPILFSLSSFLHDFSLDLLFFGSAASKLIDVYVFLYWIFVIVNTILMRTWNVRLLFFLFTFIF